MRTKCARPASNLCFAVSSIARIDSRDKQCSSLIETSQRCGARARGVARFRAALMIKLGSTRSMALAAVVALTLIAGSGSWAQTCPTSPSYSPDFSSNQSCLALWGNGINTDPTNASFQLGGSGNTLLQITPNSSQQRGYAWYTTPQPVGNSFSTTFTFQLTGAERSARRWLRIRDPEFRCRSEHRWTDGLGRLRARFRRRSHGCGRSMRECHWRHHEQRGRGVQDL